MPTLWRALAAVILVCSPSTAQAQWLPLRNAPPAFLDTCNLLTDGTVLCHGYNSNQWHRLSPDINGSYANGTWSRVADMPDGFDAAFGCTPCRYAPLYFASAVLPDGRLVVIGGEDISLRAVWTNIGFIYDPVSNSWSSQLIEAFGSGRIGDAMGTVLADGRFVLSDIGSGNIEVLNPSTLRFTPLNPPGKRDQNNEEGWNILPDGTVFTVDANRPRSYESYDPLTNSWGRGGTTPVNLADCCGSADGVGNSHEVGPGVLRPDGTLIYFSANSTGQNAVYDTATGTWTHTPAMDFPLVPFQTYHYAVADGPASLLPNGNVLVMASPVTNSSPFNAPSHFYEFDGTQLLPVADTPNAAAFKAYQGRMLLLPSGEVLLTAFNQSTVQDVLLYSNGGAPRDAWRPAITSAPVTVLPGTTYSVSGTLFNGFSEGASYGDDAQSSTNYPLVRITNHRTGHIVYGRTHDHSRMGVSRVGSTEIVTTSFEMPAGAEPGTSDLSVVVNGIASAPRVTNRSQLVDVQENVSFEVDAASMRTSSNIDGCPQGFTGTFNFEARLSNTGRVSLDAVVARVAQLSNGNLLLNADAGPSGVGGRLTIPRIGAYADGVLSPAESLDVSFSLCLQDTQPFDFFVDVLATIP